MTSDHPESQERTFKEITIAASLHFQHHFISQTQDEQLQRERQNVELAGCIHHPPLHPSISPVPMGCLGVSHLILLQGCVKTAVKWKSRDYCQQEAGKYLNCAWLSSLHPSHPETPVYFPAEIRRCLGEL